MRRVAVLNVVGLSRSLLAHAPRISAYAGANRLATLRPVLPAVTCSVQASMVTGAPVSQHGIVGNGWYDRETCEVRFWQRSNRLMHGEKVWETARRRDASFTCANLFWWYNSYSTCDWVVQARPIYKADGRKIPDCYTQPADLRDRLQSELGAFPLFRFWGPLADITSTRWIAEAAMCMETWHAPTLTLVYLPHLDYGLQKLGPHHRDIPRHVAEVDAVVGDLLDLYVERGVTPMVVSEYGIEPATSVVEVNRRLREAGLIAVREEDGLELLDPGACAAFAVADHQVAHVYVKDRSRLGEVRRLCAAMPGVEATATIDHERAGDLVLIAGEGAWFTYDYWLDDRVAPDFARTVDIHRKPGYDPRELFSDKSPPAVAWKLLKRKLGFRQLLDVISLDASLVKGTHGRTAMPGRLQPLAIGPADALGEADTLPCEQMRDAILRAVFDPVRR